MSFLLKAHGVLRDPQFLQAALRAGDTIWHKGLLRKGLGLCHGIAGNAYAFLALYRQSQDVQHLYRAWRFCEATWHPEVLKAIGDTADPQRKVRGVPDSPWSLMEGSAGLICFYLDLLQPGVSAFPAYEL